MSIMDMSAVADNLKMDLSNELLKIADKALYLAKGQGRNKVQVLSYENDHYDMENQNIESSKDEILRILTKTNQSSVSAIQLLASNYGNNRYSDYLKALLRYLDLLGKRLHLSLPLATMTLIQKLYRPCLILLNSIIC